MKEIYLIILVIAVSFTTEVIAQRGMYVFQYSVAYPAGELKDFIGKTSFRGGECDYHRMVSEKIGAGFELSWNNFYEEKAYDTYTDGTVSISGKQYRYCLALPMLVSAKYFLNPGATFNPYAGFGLGTQYTRNDADMGLYAFNDNAWHFVIKPEIGVIYNPSANFGVILSARYYEAYKSETVGKRSFFTSNLGMVWTY
jgi:opacity protein-like surface antigen